MEIDLELYRRDARVRIRPEVRLSVIDIAPEQPERTIIFLHGYGGKAVQWIYLMREFSSENRVIAIDQRGHGHSDKPRSGFTMPDLRADVEGVLDVLGINQKVVLVGHSFGGAVAAEFAVAHPERIDRLVLIATTGEFRLNSLYRLLLRLPFSTLQLLTPYTRNWLGAPPPTLKSWYQENLSRWKGWDLFPKLSVPTLTIRGHQDRVFEKPLFEEVTRLIPGVEDVDVGASGHMVMLERREAVIRAMQRFLESSPRTWREPQGTSAGEKHSTLLKARPWLPHYDDGVPNTIAVPRVPLHHLLDSAARRFPGRDAINYEGKRLTYRQLEAQVNRFANSLRTLGLQPGDRVMLLLPNLPQLVIGLYGALKAGGVAVFTLPTTDPDELIRQVKDCGARFLVTLTQFDELIYRIKTILEPSGASPSSISSSLISAITCLHSSKLPSVFRSSDASCTCWISPWMPACTCSAGCWLPQTLKRRTCPSPPATWRRSSIPGALPTPPRVSCSPTATWSPTPCRHATGCPRRARGKSAFCAFCPSPTAMA